MSENRKVIRIEKFTDCVLEIYTLSESPVSRIELALLQHDTFGFIASIQINYYTNALKNFARLERLVVNSDFQRMGYGTMLMAASIDHIRHHKIKFHSREIGKRIVSNLSQSSRLESFQASSSRGVDRIHLECDEVLEDFYASVGFTKTCAIQMKIDLTDLSFSSLI